MRIRNTAREWVTAYLWLVGVGGCPGRPQLQQQRLHVRGQVAAVADQLTTHHHQLGLHTATSFSDVLYTSSRAVIHQLRYC